MGVTSAKTLGQTLAGGLTWQYFSNTGGLISAWPTGLGLVLQDQGWGYDRPGPYDPLMVMRDL